MLVKIADYRGVIIFYLLLVGLLLAMSYQNKLIDMQKTGNINQVITNN